VNDRNRTGFLQFVEDDALTDLACLETNGSAPADVIDTSYRGAPS